MATPDITLAITVKVNPADIANLESLARDFQRLADRLRELGADAPKGDEQPLTRLDAGE